MRLGGPTFTKCDTAESWVAAVIAAGYRAAYWPLALDADSETVRAYQAAADDADIIIAEVGAWSNPLSPDPAIAAAALEKCKAALALADRIGARCCVNIAGSRGQKWDGPDPENLTDDTFDLIVSVVREIIDSANPTRSFYTLELMPWMYPDSAEAYLRLINAVGRSAFAVHLDPVNIISSPQRYFSNGQLIKECFDKLGQHIKSCHAKDILLQDNLTLHLDEVRPGKGNLDYPTFLRCLSRLDTDTPLMLEHLTNHEDYQAAAGYIRAVAGEDGVKL